MAEGDKSTAALNQRDLRLELDRLEERIAELKVQYEQYFSGVLPLPPDKLHNEIKRTIRQLTSAPFRSSEINYRLRAIKGRYLSFDEYFQRVMKQREEGSYHRDVFKADLRQKIQEEERFSQTEEGVAAAGVRSLFETYRQALEKQTGKAQELDFKAFHQSLLKRAKELKEQHGVKKLTFKVVVKNGKVSVQAKSLDP